MRVFTVLMLLVLSVPAAAQEATSLTLMEANGVYSNAVDVQATLLRDSDNEGVEGVNIEFYLRDDAGDVQVDLGVAPTDPDGVARLRVPLVNGCPFFGDVELQGGSSMAPAEYVLEARFPGGDDINNQPHDAAMASGLLKIVKERVEVVIVRGTSAVLGEALTIGAKIVDPDGDAPCDRSQVNGGAPSTVAGHRLAFFLDYTGDQDYSDPRESLGSADTTRDDPQQDAVATITADMTPIGNLPRAGVLDNAIQVQLPANDGQYLPATARGRLVLDPAPVDANQSSIETDPASPQASGDPVIITVTLRDRFGNPLGIDNPAHAVTVALVGDSLGAALDGPATRDANTGKYLQTLKPTVRAGDVTVRVDVDGTEGNTHKITFRSLLPFGPCACVETLPSPPWFLPSAALFLAVGRHLRRRRGLPPG